MLETISHDTVLTNLAFAFVACCPPDLPPVICVRWGGRPTTSAITAFHARRAKKRCTLDNIPALRALQLRSLSATNPRYALHEH